MSCKIDTRLLHATDVADLTNVELVSLESKLSESDKFQSKKFAVLLAQRGEEFVRVANSLNSMIPADSQLVRDSNQQLVGIPAVAGG